MARNDVCVSIASFVYAQSLSRIPFDVGSVLWIYVRIEIDMWCFKGQNGKIINSKYK